jgi:hypothetical protein
LDVRDLISKPLSSWLSAVFYAVVLILLSLPILSVTVPPLGDYANHLARMHILAAYGHSPALQQNYVVAWKLTPYLGMDLIVPAFARFLSVYTAGRLFLVFCLALFVLGTSAIHAALFRKFSPWPAASALFAYNLVFSLGFVNYLFGVGIWLLAFAAWIALSRQPARWRIAAGSLLSLAVFFSHYFAFIGYMLCIGAYEFGLWFCAAERNPRTLLRHGLVAGLPFIPPILIFARALNGQLGGMTEYGALADKRDVLLSPVAFQGARFDLPILGFAVVVFIAGIVSGRLRISPAMRLPLIAMGVVIIAMPNILSGVWGMDYRFPAVFVYLLIAGSTWSPLPGRLALFLATVMVGLLAANIASIVTAWRPIGARYDEFRAALPVIAKGARVIVFREPIGPNQVRTRETEAEYRHMPALAVIERDAFLPILFKLPMMSVAAAPRMKAIDSPHGRPIVLKELIAGADPVKGQAMLGTLDSLGVRNYWGGWPQNYDYAIELSFGAKPVPLPQLQLLKSGQVFNIYRVTNPAPAANGHLQ